MDNRIFINIASYRDQELWQTVESAITQAEDASRLHIAICWQDDNDLNHLVAEGWTPIAVSTINGFPVYQLRGSAAQVELIALPYQQAQGVGFARALCDRRYQQEQWFLQIDAHCLFSERWDSRLIDALTALRQESRKPLLSSYPPSYHYGEQGKIIYAEQANRISFNAFTAEGLPTLISRGCSRSTPEKGSFVAAGFIFTQGTFVTEVGNDPTIFFEGEEITLSLRAFTWGYDIYHLPTPFLWHHYIRDKSPKIWHDHNLSAQEAGEVPLAWIQRELHSQHHIKALLGLPTDSQRKKEARPLGTLRTRRQFEHQCGLNFQLISCYADCLPPRSLSYFAAPASDIAWCDAHRIHHIKPIAVFPLIGEALPDELYIHCYGYNTPRLAQYRYSPSQLTTLAGKIEVTCWSTPNRPPVLLRIASWSVKEGWGIIIEWPWSENDGPYCLL